YQDLQPVQRLILEKAFDYKIHGYITPYQQYLQSLPIKKQILVYSLMRQESDYIPSAISRSFALGLMQLMPFLVDHLAKQQHETIKNYDELFQAKKNIKYALLHLKWLEKLLDNPLYIAYAYNGGYGFFKRYKAQKRFQKEMYEPFMSMEMMKNSESREYGKHVLSNYVMYHKVFKENFSILEFYETLK
ncbi:MAG: lytic transglycosylase domain-containing protein, partial [Epsilonproteobacteria bacterium]|nr:lytic transglycosylase domain-containing protein [Campylobacterota bacterium]